MRDSARTVSLTDDRCGDSVERKISYESCEIEWVKPERFFKRTRVDGKIREITVESNVTRFGGSDEVAVIENSDKELRDLEIFGHTIKYNAATEMALSEIVFQPLVFLASCNIVSIDEAEMLSRRVYQIDLVRKPSAIMFDSKESFIYFADKHIVDIDFLSGIILSIKSYRNLEIIRQQVVTNFEVE